MSEMNGDRSSTREVEPEAFAHGLQSTQGAPLLLRKLDSGHSSPVSLKKARQKL